MTFELSSLTSDLYFFKVGLAEEVEKAEYSSSVPSSQLSSASAQSKERETHFPPTKLNAGCP
jgi:hypothetical protein